jgi:inhibitor of KinA
VPFSFQYASDQSLLVRLGDKVSLETHYRVVKLLQALSAHPIPHVRNLHPAYTTVLIAFDPLMTRHEEVQAAVSQRAGALDAVWLPQPALLEIPVYYGGEFGPDLEDVANMHGLTPEEVIRIHSGVTYTVYFLGFVPGFAYLGEVPDRIATPRVAVPRKKVEAGSVGIADNHTGVYPFATPGGWRLIGRTPLKIFRPDRAAMSLLRIGDEVRFRPV